MKTTKNTFAPSMFESIRDSLKNSDNKNNQSFRDILKFETGKTYLVRIVPNIKTPELTFFHYFNHGWTSFATGQFMSALCPSTYGETCPIDQERFKIWRNGTDQEKLMANAIKRKENWMCNVYVISDPTNPENQGKVKILRYGRQLHKIIDAAINGDDIVEYGAKIFDLTETGCTLRIKVETVAEGKKSWPTYASSRFLSPSEIEGMTEEKIQDIYGQLHDLEKVESRKTFEEIKEMLNTHYHVKINSNDPDWSINKKSENIIMDEGDDADDKIDMSPVKDPQKDAETTNDAAVEDLLRDLG